MKKTYEFNETTTKSPVKKLSGIQNLTMLVASPRKGELSDHNEQPTIISSHIDQSIQTSAVKKEEKPEKKPLPEKPSKTDYYVGGIRMNIIDIKHISEHVPQPSPPAKKSPQKKQQPKEPTGKMIERLRG